MGLKKDIPMHTPLGYVLSNNNKTLTVRLMKLDGNNTDQIVINR